MQDRLQKYLHADGALGLESGMVSAGRASLCLENAEGLRLGIGTLPGSLRMAV